MATIGNALEDLFPRLPGRGYRITSPATGDYNCIAWAAGETHRWWWPDEDGDDFWPPGAPRQESLAACEAAFARMGFVRSTDGELQAGIEKIAIYSNDSGSPKHAARQMQTGRWTSKLGLLEDVEHDLSDLEGTEYGSAVLFMERAASSGNQDHGKHR